MKIFIVLLLTCLSVSYGKAVEPNTILVSSSKADPPSPTVNVTINATLTYISEDSTTNVLLTVQNLQAVQYAAVGFSLNQSMGQAHVFICKRLADNKVIINRYINPEGHHHPEPAGSDEGGIFTPGQLLFTEGVVSCSFNLSNFTSTASRQLTAIKPLTQSAQYNPIFAAGVLNDNYDPKYHFDDSRQAQANLVQLNQNAILLYKLKDPAAEGQNKYSRVSKNAIF